MENTHQIYLPPTDPNDPYYKSPGITDDPQEENPEYDPFEDDTDCPHIKMLLPSLEEEDDYVGVTIPYNVEALAHRNTAELSTADNIQLEDKVLHKSGSTSSYCPDFAQIPLGAMISVAKRFELGAKKHGRDNWRKGLTDKTYVIERLNHVIYHCYKLINKIEGKVPWDRDDDAGGILWGGCFATEAVKHHFPEEQAQFE